MSAPDDLERRRHRRQPRPTSHWGKPDDFTPHPGDVDRCPTCTCEATASCEPGDHTYSWPCVYAPGTGEAS